MDKDSIQVWVKELKDGTHAIGIFNLNGNARNVTVNFGDIQLNSRLRLRDVWRQKDLGLFNATFSSGIPAHGVVLLKADAS